MPRWTVSFAMALGAALSACSTEYSVAPVAQDGQQIRYAQGRATTYSEKAAGAIQVTPLGLNDRMRPAFEIAAFNKSPGPSNFGVENVTLELANGSLDKVFTSNELVHEAKVAAQWAEAATILAGGLAAGAAQANAYSTTNGAISTPYGGATFYARTYDPAAAYLGTASAAAATGYGLQRIEASLDATIANYRNNILQTTTVDSDQTTGGVVVADALSSSDLPENIVLHIRWNGDEHDFRFVVAEGAAPAAAPAAPASLPPVFTDRQEQAQSGAVPAAPASPQAQPALVSFEQWNHKKK
ncbi:MAG: hypothetical protein JOZ72_14245 [Alphaproteobacteria bacterium]|nr:hypothetical protein [Alphaproteobacteria bacterium]